MFCLASAAGGVLAEGVGIGALRLHDSWAVAGILGAVAGGVMNYLLASRLSWIRPDPASGATTIFTRFARATRN